VYGNDVEHNADWGIALFGATNSKIGAVATGKANTASNNGEDGIFLGEYNTGQKSSGNVVSYNTADDNGNDGILAAGADSSGDQQATGNTFSHNSMTTDAIYDAQDLSTGTKTGHTANTWNGDTCSPTGDSDPVAICH
jgi:hypothetical protein